MRLLFIKECIDKNTKVKYTVGQELVFPVERAKEILCTGYAVLIDDKEEPQEQKEDLEEVEVPQETAEKAEDTKPAKKARQYQSARTRNTRKKPAKK